MTSPMDIAVPSSLSGNAATDLAFFANTDDAGLLSLAAGELSADLAVLGASNDYATQLHEVLRDAIDSFQRGTTTPKDFKALLIGVVQANIKLYERVLQVSSVSGWKPSTRRFMSHEAAIAFSQSLFGGTHPAPATASVGVGTSGTRISTPSRTDAKKASMMAAEAPTNDIVGLSIGQLSLPLTPFDVGAGPLLSVAPLDIPFTPFANFLGRHHPLLAVRLRAWRHLAEHLVAQNPQDLPKIEMAYLELGKQMREARRWELARKSFNIAARAARGEVVTTNIDTEPYVRVDRRTLDYLLYRKVASLVEVGGYSFATPAKEMDHGTAGQLFKIYGMPWLYKRQFEDLIIRMPDRYDASTTMSVTGQELPNHERFIWEILGLEIMSFVAGPEIAACQVVDFHIELNGSWMIKQFVFGPELGDLEKTHWGLSHEEIAEARRLYDETVERVNHFDVKGALERAASEGRELPKSIQELLKQKKGREFFDELMRDGFKPFDRPWRNMIFDLDPSSPTYKKWVVIDF